MTSTNSVHASDLTTPRVALGDIVAALDAELRTSSIPDYPVALNGLQVANDGHVTRVAVAVDASMATIAEAAVLGADLLIVHHGLFWGGLQPVVGVPYHKQRTLMANNIAVYSTHLPLDAHATLGNNVLLANAIGLTPSSGFGNFKGIDISVAGETDMDATDVVERTRAVVARYGGTVRTSLSPLGRRCKRWAMVSGGGASSDTLREARERGIDTFITGEGPHHTTVEAQEQDLLIVYAGHYATETLGVQALGAWIEQRFGVPWSFLHLPTGS